MQLIQVVMDNNIKEVNFLIAKGADVNMCEDQDEIGPLHFVVQNNDLIDIVRALVEADGNLNAENADGMTPLDVAELYEDPEVINYLRGFLSIKYS